MQIYENFQIAIQARMGSSRFPGKVLKPLDGVPMLGQQLKALQSLGGCGVLVATSTSKVDNAIAQFCKDNDVSFIRGDEDDVFSRYREMARNIEREHIVRLTGDNPIVSPHLLTHVMKRHLKSGSDFTSTRVVKGEQVERFLPKGWSVDIIRRKTLLAVNEDLLTPFAREHVIPPFYSMDIKVDLVKDFKDLDLPTSTVDTPQDLVDLQRKIQDIGGFNAYMKDFNQRVEAMLVALSGGKFNETN